MEPFFIALLVAALMAGLLLAVLWYDAKVLMIATTPLQGPNDFGPDTGRKLARKPSSD